MQLNWAAHEGHVQFPVDIGHKLSSHGTSIYDAKFY